MCEEATEVETHHQQTAIPTMGIAEDETPSSLTSHPNVNPNNPNQEDKKSSSRVLFLGKVNDMPSRTYPFDEPISCTQLPHEDFNKCKKRFPIRQSVIFKEILSYKNKSSQPGTVIFKIAIRLTIEKFCIIGNTKMLHLKEVFDQDNLEIWKHSPGVQWKELGYKTNADIRADPNAIQRIRLFWHKIKFGEKPHLPDCTAIRGSDVCENGTRKTRVIWNYPATITFGEAVFAVPLTREFRTSCHSPFENENEKTTDRIKRLTKRFRKYKWYTTLKFSNFDKTVPAWAIIIAFDILALNVNFVEYENDGVAHAKQMISMFWLLRDYFINTKVRMATGHRFQKRCGIPNGSYFTQLVRTIVNHILILWFSLELYGVKPLDDIYLGEDSLVASSHPWDLAHCQALAKSVGMEVDVDMSMVTQDLKNVTFPGHKIKMNYYKKGL